MYVCIYSIGASVCVCLLFMCVFVDVFIFTMIKIYLAILFFHIFFIYVCVSVIFYNFYKNIILSCCLFFLFSFEYVASDSEFLLSGEFQLIIIYLWFLKWVIYLCVMIYFLWHNFSISRQLVYIYFNNM